MSKLPRCNYCTLKHIERAELQKDEPLPVTTRPVRMPGDYEYWMGVFIGDATKPVALFPQLTVHCVC